MMQNASESSSSVIPPELQAKVINKRQFHGYTVSKVGKTGSALYLLESDGRQGLVRNAEIKAASMAVWEFVHSQAQTLFPQEQAERLFGVWSSPQVAPILEKDGKDRVYYRGDKANAYSEMVGFDTMRLAEVWHLNDVFQDYTVQVGGFSREDRWLDSTTYHLTSDVISEIPWLNTEGALEKLLTEYWNEFIRLNSHKIVRADLLARKELRRKDMDSDDPYQSSIALVETGHKICAYLREKHTELKARPNDALNWKGKPADVVILFLLHLYQTSTQQMLLWWLGVAHGHLHLYNTVSRIPKNDSKELSPLETRVIDFDNSRVSVEKLASNDEIYTVVDVHKVKSKIFDSALNINLRLQFILYLPLKAWDDEILKLLDANEDKPISRNALRLISQRLVKDIDDQNKFTWFLQYMYQKELKCLKADSYFAFSLIMSVVKSKPELVTSQYPVLKTLADFFTNGLESLSTEGFTDAEKQVILSGISYANDGLESVHDLLKSHFQFVFPLRNSEGFLGKQAMRLVENVINDTDEVLIQTLIQESANDDVSLQLINDILWFIFSGNEEGQAINIQRNLMKKLVEKKLIDQALENLNLRSISKTNAVSMYKNIRDRLADVQMYKNQNDERTRVIAKWDAIAEQPLGKITVLIQKVRSIFGANSCPNHAR